LVKFDPSATQVLAKIVLGYPLFNMAIDGDGQVAVGRGDGKVFLTNDSLTSAASFATNEWNVFVTFNHYIPGTVPPLAGSFVVSGFPSPSTAGVAGSFTVTAEDANGHIATGYTGTVHFTSSDAQAVLPANYTFVAADAGVHTFSTTLKTVGGQSITATDAAIGSITGTQTRITVNPAAASSLAVFGFPSPVISGQAQNFSVKALDPYGNTATGYTGKVHFTSTDGAAALPADYTFLGSDAGVHAFSATLETAGTQALTATDTVTASITGAEASILVKPASFIVSGFPSPTTAGVAHSFSVTAKNANGTTRHRLHRPGPFHEQRCPGRLACRLHLRGRGRRYARI